MKRLRLLTEQTSQNHWAANCKNRIGVLPHSTALFRMMQKRCIGATSRQRVVRTSLARQSIHITCTNAVSPPVNREKLRNKHVVIIGGTGRVGSSTASTLLKEFPGVSVTVASRSESSYTAAVQRKDNLRDSKFKAVDINDINSVKEAISGSDLVINCAGPFQQSNNMNVLEAAIATKTPYMDVSDDSSYSERARSYNDKAKAAGIPAITSTGIFPGMSSVMAAHIISITRKEYDDDWNYRTPEQGEGISPNLLRYSYYTAGSGGAGPTILETSLLLAGEPVVVYKEGEKFTLPAVSNRREVDFGPGVGRKGTYLYNLPEVGSAYKYLGVKGVSARFGTDPFIWNWGMWLVARLLPSSLLSNREFVKKFAGVLGPIVAAVDASVGERVAMRIEVDFEQNKNAAGLFVHKKLSESVGYCVSAFALSVLQGKTQPGVWYPEEKEALADRREVLTFASTGASKFVLNRPAWALESEVVQIGGLIYW